MMLRSSLIFIVFFLLQLNFVKSEVVVEDNKVIIPFSDLNKFIENENTDSLQYKISFVSGTSFNIIPSNLNYEILNHGVKRGINLYSLILKGKQKEEFTIEIQFDNPTITSEINSIERMHFHGIVNPQYVNSLISNKNKRKPTLQNDKQWYDPELNYAEIITKSDKIYRISMSDIIKCNS